jgi:ATP-dependent protease ClpP protease subunit
MVEVDLEVKSEERPKLRFAVANEKTTEVDLLLYGGIGGWYWDDISANEFCEELQNITTYYPNIKKINVRINSTGGAVIDGLAMFNAIQNINKNVAGVSVDTHIDGVALSAAGWVALAGKNIYMVEYGQFMMHNPYCENNSPEMVPAIKAFTDSIVTIFKSKMNKSEVEIKQMMNAETWLGAEECLNLGIITKIVPIYNKSVFDNHFAKLILNKKTQELQNFFSKNLENFMANNTQNPYELPEEISKALQVQNTAEALGKIKKLQNREVELITEIQNLKNENTALKAESEAQKKNVIETILDAAVSEGKLKEEDKKTWNALFETNFENAKNALDTIKVVKVTQNVVPISKAINQPQNANSESGDRSDWDYIRWTKEDPKGLEKMQKENPEALNALQNAYLETRKKS